MELISTSPAASTIPSPLSHLPSGGHPDALSLGMLLKGPGQLPGSTALPIFTAKKKKHGGPAPWEARVLTNSSGGKSPGNSKQFRLVGGGVSPCHFKKASSSVCQKFLLYLGTVLTTGGCCEGEMRPQMEKSFIFMSAGRLTYY